MEMHGILPSCFGNVRKTEFSIEIVQQVILNNKHEFLVDRFERPNLMMKLHQYRLGRHFPVHSVAAVPISFFPNSTYAHNAKEALPSGPHCARSVQCLELNAYEVRHLPITRRDQDIIYASSRYGNLGHNVDFIAGLVPR